MCTVYNATSRTKYQPVKIIVSGTQDKMLFFSRKSKIKNHPVKNSVKSAHILTVHRVPCYFSLERVKLKSTILN